MNNQKVIAYILISLICSSLLLGLYGIGLFSNIELVLTDALYGGKTALPNIKIIGVDDKSLQKIGRWPWNRAVFVETLSLLSEAKIVGVDIAFFEESEKNSDELLAAQVKKNRNVIMPVEYTNFIQTGSKVAGNELLEPYPALKEATINLGYVNIITDNDGISRAINLDLSNEYENFAYAIYKHAIDGAKNYFGSRFVINFIGKPYSFEYYSITDVIDGVVSAKVFKDSIVLIGATSPDMHDDYFVPTSSGKAMPGVEVHANIIQTMILGSQLEKQNWFSLFFIILINGLIITLVCYLISFRIGFIVSVIMNIIYLFFVISYFNKNSILNILYPLFSIWLSYFSSLCYSYLNHKKHKKEILNAFGKYVSSDVIAEILKNPDKLRLGGEKKEITIFFSDIRGFTPFSEKLTPEQLVHSLNEYLTRMTTIIMKNGGTVDKYMGDAIMAFWGAPLNDKDHAVKACASSIKMMSELKQLQSEWESQSLPTFDIGIGLNTGFAVVGNMGSYDRFDYTAMGDTVNLGSRLEGTNKEYCTHIIISQFTQKLIKNNFVTRKLDMVRVKGKNEPITIYELVSFGNEKSALILDFEKGFELYQQKKFDSALNIFKKHGEDGPSKVFISRCEEFLKNPPDPNWDGVWVMKSK
ncbi:adenylate/guanylate cyclase domain-containing protein [Candidatus Woesearchaeota archaeon]|nr:adenylate/guanylate cyclase domain-containing protein [Candidatus Woesearchaeota archaeon]